MHSFYLNSMSKNIYYVLRSYKLFNLCVINYSIYVFLIFISQVFKNLINLFLKRKKSTALLDQIRTNSAFIFIFSFQTYDRLNRLYSFLSPISGIKISWQRIDYRIKTLFLNLFNFLNNWIKILIFQDCCSN